MSTNANTKYKKKIGEERIKQKSNEKNDHNSIWNKKEKSHRTKKETNSIFLLLYTDAHIH